MRLDVCEAQDADVHRLRECVHALAERRVSHDPQYRRRRARGPDQDGRAPSAGGAVWVHLDRQPIAAPLLERFEVARERLAWVLDLLDAERTRFVVDDLDRRPLGLPPLGCDEERSHGSQFHGGDDAAGECQ